VRVSVNDKTRQLRHAQRKKVEARATKLMAEEMTLRELRKARKLTQLRIAKVLKITHLLSTNEAKKTGPTSRRKHAASNY
jgi:hypothetical protein